MFDEDDIPLMLGASNRYLLIRKYTFKQKHYKQEKQIEKKRKKKNKKNRSIFRKNWSLKRVYDTNTNKD